MEYPIRINKFLSESGFCSRRKADEYIERGKVTINGKVPELGTKIMETDEVQVDGKLVSHSPIQKLYIAFNKPVGIVCTSENDENNIIDYLNFKQRIYTIGRLDKASHGLILLTNDGDIVNPILRTSYNHEKEYWVTVRQTIRPDFIEKMSTGVAILDTVTKPCVVKQRGPKSFKIILTQGLNRQIRRMCEELGYEVESLKRVRIMHIHLDLPIGKWRHLTTEELAELRKAAAMFDNKTGVHQPH